MRATSPIGPWHPAHTSTSTAYVRFSRTAQPSPAQPTRATRIIGRYDVITPRTDSILCAAGTTNMELRAGNGTFDGPGDYVGGPQLYDATFALGIPGDHFYDTNSENDSRSAMSLHIDPAPATDDQTKLNAFAPAGSVVAGKFHATYVAEYDIRADGTSGRVDGVLVPAIDGAFYVLVR